MANLDPELYRKREIMGFQERLEPGDFYARWDEEASVLVFGEVVEWADHSMWDREPEHRRVRAHSVLNPEGEYWKEHLADMIPISADVFALAKENGWQGCITEVVASLTAAIAQEYTNGCEN